MSGGDNYDAMDAKQLRHFIRLRDRQIATSTRFWIIAAKEALAGKPQALRNRVQLAETPSAELVQSEGFSNPHRGEPGEGLMEGLTTREMMLNELATNSIELAARMLNATPADIPGLWNVPGYPELTTGQLLSVAREMG